MAEMATVNGDQRRENRTNGPASRRTNGVTNKASKDHRPMLDATASSPPAPVEADSFPALRQNLVEHLTMLRAEFRETVANYSIHVQGLLTQLEDGLADQPSELTDRERDRRARALRQALKDAEGLNLKPVKGRRRDLKKVETFANHLNDLIDEW